MLKFLPVLLLALFAVGCAETYEPVDPVIYKSPTMKVFVERVKDHGDKFDVKSRITNDSDDAILIFFNAVQCFKGKIQGEATYTFGIGERLINIPPGSTKRMDFVCKLGRDVQDRGYRLLIRTVFDNPSNDGRTQGKLLLKNVEGAF